MNTLDPALERAEHLQRQANVLLAEGEHAQAEKRYREARDMLLAVYGPSHPRYSESVRDLALAYVAMGRYKEATTLHQQVIDIARATAGENALPYLVSLHNLATVHRATGSFSEAEQLYRQALDGYKRLHDPAAIAGILTDLAWVYAITGRVREALAAMSDSESARDQMISRVVSRGSEQDQTTCVESLRQGYYLFLSIVLRYFPGSPDAPGVLLDIIFRRKALGLELSLARRVALMSEPKFQPRLEAYRLLRQQIARKTLRCSSANESPDRKYRDLQNRQTERREEEAALSREISDVNLFQETLGVISLHAVASALLSSSVLVEFVKFRRYDVASMQIHENNRWQEYRYAAFVLLAGAPQAVRMIDLGDAGTIDRLISRFRSCIIGRTNVQYRGLVSGEEPSTAPLESPGLALRAALFDPIRRIIGDRSRVILATDGELTRLPFEALPLDCGTRYLGDDYCLSYLDSGRELLRARTGSNTLASSPVVIADPEFDLSKGDGYHRSRYLLQALLRKWRGRGGPEKERPDAGDKASNRQTPNTRYKQWYFERLPGTRIEGEIIASMLGVPLWHGPAALANHLKARRSPRILHLATHGFFLSKHRSHSDPSLPGSESEPWLFPLENPLLYSGLALAGANHVFTREVLPEDGNDGVLTSEDVAGLDLLGTELVVLSACETGLGEVAIGEGVLGLRRAFILAGAQTLIMSLWKVADLPTAIFMARIYKNLIEAHRHRDEALREAQHYVRQLTVGQLRDEWLNTESFKRLAADHAESPTGLNGYLEQPDPYRPFEHPYYWGGFILLGETARLAAGATRP